MTASYNISFLGSPEQAESRVSKKGNTLTVKMKGTLDESNLSTVFKMTKK